MSRGFDDRVILLNVCESEVDDSLALMLNTGRKIFYQQGRELEFLIYCVVNTRLARTLRRAAFPNYGVDRLYNDFVEVGVSLLPATLDEHSHARIDDIAEQIPLGILGCA